MSSGRIIQPGAPGPRPVDPSDPTKGVIQEVYNAAILTAAVNELAERTERLAGGLLNLMQLQNSLSLEAGELMEHLAILLLPVVELNLEAAGGVLTDDEEESKTALLTFIEQRETARAEVAAQMAAQEAAVEVVKDAVDAGETPDLFIPA